MRHAASYASGGQGGQGGKAASKPGIRDRAVERMLAARDQMLSQPAFHRWASRTPVIRRFASKEARSAFDLCAGFVYSQILFACVELRLLEQLRAGPQTLDQIAERASLTAPNAQRLVLAAVSLRILQKRGCDSFGQEKFGLGMLGAALVANPGVLKMVEHHRALYEDLADPVALLRGTGRGTQLAKYWPYAACGATPDLQARDVEDYTQLMASSQSLVAGEILDAYDVSAHRTILDIGGGDGTFLCAAAKRAPKLDLMLFDLPAVAARAEQKIARECLTDRVRVVGGSFKTDALPQGADLISLVRIVHDHDDDVVMKLLAAVHRALPPLGTLLIGEPMAQTRGAEPMGDAYFGFYLLAMGSGRPRSAGELIAMTRAAGFASARAVATRLPLQTSLIVARS